jgi:hypothetical protein
MRFRFRRKVSRTAAEPLRLGTSSGFGRPPETITIETPDLYQPVGHALPVEMPNAADLELRIAQLVSMLAEANALDDGTPYVMDYWLDAQRPALLTLVHNEAATRRTTARRLVAVDTENLTRAAVELQELRRRRRLLEHELVLVRSELLGQEPNTMPANEFDVTDAPKPVHAHGMPGALDLNRLLPVQLQPTAGTPTPEGHDAGPEQGIER